MGNRTVSYSEEDMTSGNIKVEYIVSGGTKLVRGFDSPFLARKFANKIKHSSKCTLVSYLEYK